MMKKILNRSSFCLVFLTISVPLFATDVDFSYDKLNQSLTLSGKLCEYGRQSKSKLPALAIDKTQKQVQNQELEFIKQIKNLEQGMAGKRLEQAKLAIFYQLTPKLLNLDYYFEGNDSCANFNADLLLNFEQNFTGSIELGKPQVYSFISKTDSHSILKNLQQAYPDIDMTAIDDKALTLVGSDEAGYGVYQFAYAQFKQAQAMNQASFYVQGDEQLSKGLIKYLTNYGFYPVDSIQQAYWQLTIEHKGNESFELSYRYKDKAKVMLKPNSSLPFQLNAETNEEQLNLIVLQLELMALIEKLK